jgi:hypothetical protein
MSMKKKSSNTIGHWTRDLMACSAMPQPTAPQLQADRYTVNTTLAFMLYLLIRQRQNGFTNYWKCLPFKPSQHKSKAKAPAGAQHQPTATWLMKSLPCVLKFPGNQLLFTCRLLNWPCIGSDSNVCSLLYSTWRSGPISWHSNLY